MKRIATAILGLGLTLAPLAHADQWSKTFNLTGKPELSVTTSDGHIRVDTWDQNTVTAEVTTEGWKIGEDGVKVIEHQMGDSVELQVRLPREFCFVCIHTRSHRVEIHIRMPREGRVSLHTGDGSIQLRNFKGDMDLESSDGEEEIEGVDGTLRAHTSDGHIRASGRFDSLQLSTSDGRLDAHAMPGSTISSGWNLRSSDGSIALQLPETFVADVDLTTGDGHISIDLPVTVEGEMKHNRVRGKLNGGGNLLTIHTSDGSIHVEKS